MKLVDLLERIDNDDVGRVPNPLGDPPANIYDMMDIFYDIEVEFAEAFAPKFAHLSGIERVTAMSKFLKSHGKEQVVDISKLVPIEPNLDPLHLSSTTSTAPVEVYMYNGVMYLNDGNHRAAKAKLAGKTTILANVIDLAHIVRVANQ